ncbi:hypothetical protein ABFO63_11930 [Acinetobacter junii]|nr:hypothetical protein [Acinetobacter junii]
MPSYLLALLTSCIFLLSACNDGEQNSQGDTVPKPPTNCKMHCAP